MLNLAIPLKTKTPLLHLKKILSTESKNVSVQHEDRSTAKCRQMKGLSSFKNVTGQCIILPLLLLLILHFKKHPIS